MFQVDFCGSWFHCKVLNILTLLSRHFYCVLSHSQYLSNNQRARNLASVIEKSVLYHFREEADEFVEIGALNGLFVLGRSIGFIGK